MAKKSAAKIEDCNKSGRPDWHASHYVKVMLDQIFGDNNFKN
jgi:hypothetical protein